MTTEMVDIEMADGGCDAYVTYPDGCEAVPGVIFYMDALGLRPVLYEMADRIAERGYYVLLPNTFYRSGSAPLLALAKIHLPENRPKRVELALSLTPERVLRDAGSFLKFLGRKKRVCSERIGIVGYCMGGAMVLRAAAHYANRVSVGASFHAGRLATTAPDSPHRLAGQIRAVLYLAHADQDPAMPAEEIKRLETTLIGAGVRFRSEVYKGALHGFTMSDLPTFDRNACDRHWERLLTVLGNVPRGDSCASGIV